MIVHGAEVQVRDVRSVTSHVETADDLVPLAGAGLSLCGLPLVAVRTGDNPNEAVAVFYRGDQEPWLVPVQQLVITETTTTTLSIGRVVPTEGPTQGLRKATS